MLLPKHARTFLLEETLPAALVKVFAGSRWRKARPRREIVAQKAYDIGNTSNFLTKLD
jgi:hypothetical protein